MTDLFGQLLDINAVTVKNSSGATVTPSSITGWDTNTLSIAFNSSLADGVYTVTLDHTAITDELGNPLNGNQSNGDDVRHFTIDTHAETPSVPVLDTATDSGVLGDNVTKFTLPGFHGTGENGATVMIYRNGAAVGSGVVTGGVYQITITPALTPDAAYSITARATDLAGNTGAMSGPLSLRIDTAPPAVVSVVPSLTTVTDANAGTAQWPPTAAGVDFRVTFSEPMNDNLRPTLSFTPDVSSTLHYNFGFWINSTTYLAAYDVLGPTPIPYVPAVGVVVTLGQDVAGNVQTPGQGTDDFDLNPNPVTVVSAVPSVTKITDTNVGNAGDPSDPNHGFAVRITYSGPMSIQPYSYPTVTFTTDVSSTLHFNASQSWWINAYTYKAAFDVWDANAVVSAVGIRAAGRSIKPPGAAGALQRPGRLPHRHDDGAGPAEQRRRGADPDGGQRLERYGFGRCSGYVPVPADVRQVDEHEHHPGDHLCAERGRHADLQPITELVGQRQGLQGRVRRDG